MPYTLPPDVDQRPVAVIGGGTLGRRIAATYAAGGSEVRVFDTSAEQRQAACDFVAEQAGEFQRTLELSPPRVGPVACVDEVPAALDGAWMVVEAVPERLELKQQVFGELDRLAADDAILATNSSSLPSSSLVDSVQRPERLLNTHYLIPPDLNAVELMSCGKTDDGVIPALMDKLPQYGLVPFHVRRESVGFIVNRVWAAIKRECLMVVEEGVAPPQDVDRLWQIFFNSDVFPFRLMDRVGLDVVLDIEEHYAAIRPGIPEGPRKLLREYVEQGRLGQKTGRGFYEYPG
jgi:3-hydroxybutyryl-CoA dehydrogenase